MKPLLFACLIAFLALPAQGQSLDEIRLLYRDATESETSAKHFYEQVKDVAKDGKPVMVAYKGAGLMLLARYTKLSERGAKVREAATWIEDAAARAPNEAEIRLVRLSVQENLPKIVRYSQHINADREFIENALPAIEDNVLRKMISSYFEKYSK